MRFDAIGTFSLGKSMVLAIIYQSGEKGITTEEVKEEFGKLKYLPLALWFFITQGIFCEKPHRSSPQN